MTLHSLELLESQIPWQTKQGREQGQKAGQILVPEEAVEVPMAHVLKDHEQRATLSADSKEAHNVLVL